ncbi:MAG TPA: fibronectin type III domain-containing protein [Blastocatellia bacterium]|nr:fibronectin type III domain-containing protein [Blastocatellia bacterium]
MLKLKLRHLALLCSILVIVGASVTFGQVDCTGVATWDPVVLYLAADHTHVVFQGRLYEAVVDSRVAQPQPGGNTWWRDLGACGGTPPPPPPPTGVQIAGAWIAGTAHAAQAGSNRALVFTAHAEHNGTLSLNSVTYGGRAMTKIIERTATSAGSPTIAYTAAFILNESGIAAAANGTFVVTWSITPTQPPAFSSVFLINADQSALIRASASGVSNSATATAAALATASGDRVIVAATNGNTGSYTLNNGFTEALEVAPGSADGVAGSKAATGANETPSVTHSAVNRQSVVGFVVRGGTGGGGDTQAPTVPTNLRVTATTASSVSLAWDASTDNVGVTGYDVFQGTTLAGGTTTTSFMVNGLNCNTLFVFTVKAKDAAGNVSVSSMSVSATTLNCVVVNPGPRIYAPYADMGLFPTFNMTQTANATGVKFFTMAFINSRGCEATWFGILSLSDPFATERGNDINSLRALGGDAIISFGGASGAELAEVCGSASATQAQYQRVITMYGLKRVDFDIEGAAVASPASVNIRNQAIAGLQRMNPGLEVSYTLPVLPTGLTQDGINLLKNAVQNGVNLTTLNLMTFDYGASFQGVSADLHIQAINSTADQLGQAGLLPQLSQAQRRAMMSITIMNGNDDQGRVTSLQDAQQVLSAARAGNWKGIRMWGIHRDHPCTGGGNLTCSGIPQGDFAFSNIFKVFP